MFVSLIIPVNNAYKYVKNVLNSVVRNFDFKLGEVIIVDDCSERKTARLIDQFLQKYSDKFILIRNELNLGYLRSCNNAVKHARGDIVVLLNSDCEIPKNFVPRVIACFESDRKIIAASPIASNSASYCIKSVLPMTVIDKMLQSRRKPIYPDISNAEGFCFCVRKSYIDKFGFFDPIYGDGYCEEVDFSYSVRNKGYRCVLIDNLYVKHARNKSFKTKRSSALAKNNQILYEKWADFINLQEIKGFESPMKFIIEDVFGKFSLFIFFIAKLQRQLVANRLKTLKNIFRFNQCCRSSSSKKVVYTAIVGNCDIIPIVQDYVREDWIYVCFTDNKTLLKLGKFGNWLIRPLAFDSLDSTKNARWHKTHPFELFPDSEENLWIDANINILTSSIFELVENSYCDLLVPKHYCRNSIYKELDVVTALSKEKKENINKVKEFLLNNNMPDNFGLNETNIIYRKPTKRIIKLMSDWWQMIETFSKRDQVSFSYVLWKNSVDINSISIPNARIDGLNFKIFTHNKTDTLTGKILSFIFNPK